MKKGLIFIFIISFILINGILISAVCCERFNNKGMWCHSATDANECDADYYIWKYSETCDSVTECSGTCVNANTGECSQYTAKTQCKESGGVWYEQDPGEISACQEVCCLLGEDAYFINPTECKKMFTDNGIQGVIREDITSRDSCLAMKISIEVGACVIETLSEKTCVMSTNLDCTTDKISELAQYLSNAGSENQIDIHFEKGLLCTAPGISDCAKSPNTECKNNKIYYKDTCGNFANVYDSDKYNSPDYWTYIRNPNTEEVCTTSSSGSNKCGNCDPSSNTVCQNYKDADGITKPSQGELVCGGLSCTYKEKTYEHGESWCAELTGSENTGIFIINQNSETGYITDSNRTALENGFNKYNLPGSRYYKLLCSFGEVLVEECGDYRNSICVQGNDELGNTYASCMFNTWRTCFQAETKTECENPNMLCKWVSGYRWDFEIVPEDQRKEKQGSCVPLVAPGFDFWKGTSQGNAICAMAIVKDAALFETSWKNSRNNFASWSDATHAQQCINGCYTIPSYGAEFNQKPGEEKAYSEEIKTAPSSLYQVLTLFYDHSGFPLPNTIDSYHLSTRRGQYCNKDGKPDQWLTGKIGKNQQAYDCTPNSNDGAKTERKTRDYPIYLTNDEWINSLTERVRSLGDCGYKANLEGQYSPPESEIITAIFQKMSQDMDVKEDITVEQIMFKGGKYIEGDLEKYETTLPYKAESTDNCAEKYGGICMSTVNNPEPCIGGTVNAEAICPQKAVCCVFDVNLEDN